MPKCANGSVWCHIGFFRAIVEYSKELRWLDLKNTVNMGAILWC
jgi:hypothetical protein